MKKYISLLLAIVMIFAFAACSKSIEQGETTTEIAPTDTSSFEQVVDEIEDEINTTAQNNTASTTKKASSTNKTTTQQTTKANQTTTKKGETTTKSDSTTTPQNGGDLYELPKVPLN